MKEISLKDKLKGEKLSSPKTLTGAAMLVALYTILSIFTLKLSTTWEIGFAWIALAVCGMLYGPLVGGVAGAVGDTLGFIVSPNGGFFPGFTLSAFIMGFLYGLFLYGKPVSLKRILSAELVVIVIVAHLRVIEHVVEISGVLKFPGQLFDLLFRFHIDPNLLLW